MLSIRSLLRLHATSVIQECIADNLLNSSFRKITIRYFWYATHVVRTDNSNNVILSPVTLVTSWLHSNLSHVDMICRTAPRPNWCNNTSLSRGHVEWSAVHVAEAGRISTDRGYTFRSKPCTENCSSAHNKYMYVYNKRAGFASFDLLHVLRMKPAA